jgi:hypothetical protein
MTEGMKIISIEKLVFCFQLFLIKFEEKVGTQLYMVKTPIDFKQLKLVSFPNYFDRSEIIKYVVTCSLLQSRFFLRFLKYIFSVKHS